MAVLCYPKAKQFGFTARVVTECYCSLQPDPVLQHPWARGLPGMAHRNYSVHVILAAHYERHQRSDYSSSWNFRHSTGEKMRFGQTAPLSVFLPVEKTMKSGQLIQQNGAATANVKQSNINCARTGKLKACVPNRQSPPHPNPFPLLKFSRKSQLRNKNNCLTKTQIFSSC